MLVVAPSGIPFPAAPVSAVPMGETLRVFVVAGTHVPSGSTGCMARPVKSMRFHKEKASRFAGTLQGPTDAAQAQQGALARDGDAQEADRPDATTPSQPRTAAYDHRKCAVVLDVRTEQEWRAGHISCAHFLPVQDEPAGWQAELLSLAGGDKNSAILTYCHSGVRSAEAATLLKKAGYSRVLNGGGYTISTNVTGTTDRAALEKVCEACRDATNPTGPSGDAPFLKPHPTVSAFESASEVQYTVGTLGEGKRAYVDDTAVWAHVPTLLLGRPSIMTAVKDTASEGTLVSMFVDEQADVYILLPAAKKTRKAKASSASQALSWLPFRLPSLLGGHRKKTPEEKDDIPSWMQGEYHVVPDLTAVLTSGDKFDVWRKRVPVLGFLELGGNEGKTKGLKRGMYVAVLVPSVANVSIEESLPLGFPGGGGGGKGTNENGEEGRLLAKGAAHGSGDKARGPTALAGAGKQHVRGARGARGRRVHRHRDDDARESARHTRRGRQSIMKALAELKRRLAANSHGQQASTESANTLGGNQRTRYGAASGAGQVLAHVQRGERQEAPPTGGRVAGGISADDLSNMVDRCHGRDEAGRCLVRAQACMSSRAMTDPANCRCFVDAVESFAASGASEGSCTASCMAAVEQAYNGHVMRVTGLPSPCL